MATWFPLIINTGSSQIQELPSGDNLDLTGSNISNVAAITINSSGGTSIVNGGANATGNIGSASSYFNTVFAKATSAQYADLAENYLSDAAYPPGTVVSFGGNKEITISQQDQDSCVVGVISTNPAYRMNAGLTGEHVLPLALAGRVPCLVQGPVKRGDMMVSAGNGRARAEKSPTIGTVLGKSLEDFSGDLGVIEILVSQI
jgi:hypothetical protein